MLRYILFFLLLFLFSSSLIAQTTKEIVLGTSHTSWANNISLDKMGNMYIAGYYNRSPHLIITDIDGNIKSDLQIGERSGEMYKSVADDDNNVYTVGQAFDPVTSSQSAYVAKINPARNVAFSYFYGFGTLMDTKWINGYLYAVGGTSFNPDKALVLKIAQDGTLVWRKEFTIGSAAVAWNLEYTKSNIYVTGTTRNSNGMDYFVLKLDYDGQVNWVYTYDLGGFEWGTGMAGMQDGGVSISGHDGASNMLTIRLDPDGNVIWANTVDGFYTWQRKWGIDMLENRKGDVVIAAEATNKYAEGSSDGYIIELDGNTGDLHWANLYSSGQSIQDGFHGIIESSCGYIASGWYGPFFGSPSWDYVVVYTDKLGNTGCSTPVQPVQKNVTVSRLVPNLSVEDKFQRTQGPTKIIRDQLQKKVICTGTNIIPEKPTIDPLPSKCVSLGAGKIQLSADKPDGDWFGIGITDRRTGIFDPALAGLGEHLIIYNACGGLDSMRIQVTDLKLVANINDVSCDYASDGDITISGIGGVEPYTFSDGNFSPTNGQFGALDTGIYNLTITDAIGCMVDTSITLKASSPKIDSISIQNLCNNQSIAKVFFKAEDGKTSWSDGQSGDEVALGKGTFQVTVTDVNGCLADTQITTAPSVIEIKSIVITPETCDELGSIQINSPAADQFSWEDGNTSDRREGLSRGVYTVTVSNAQGCQVDTSVTVPSDKNLDINEIETENETCANLGSARLKGSSGLTYTWPDGIVSSYRTDLLAGSYQVTISNTNCSFDTTVVIDKTGGPSIDSLVFAHETCTKKGKVQLFIKNNETLEWSDGSSDATRTDLSAGFYQVTITDELGCTQDTSFEIKAELAEPIDSIITKDETCQDLGQISFYGTGFSFAWSDGSTSSSRTDLEKGTYTVSMIDSNGCTTDTSITIAKTGGPEIDSILASSNCDNTGSLEIIVSDTSYSYQWSNGQSGIKQEDLSPGIYQVTVSEGSCSNVESAVVPDIPILRITDIQKQEANCSATDGVIELSAEGQGAISYNWNDNPQRTISRADKLVSGTYGVTLTDERLCQIDTTIELSNNEGPSINAVDIQHTSCGEDNGQISMILSNHENATFFLNENPVTTTSFDNLAAGTYHFKVIDSICEDSETIMIQPSENPIIRQSTIINPSCGESNGSIELLVGRGVAPYQFQWSSLPGNKANLAENLFSGRYQVTVTDKNQCSVNTTILLSNISELRLDSFQMSPEYCDRKDGSLKVFTSGGIEPLTYSWSNGQSTSKITDLEAGKYALVVEDSAQCKVQTDLHVLEQGGVVIEEIVHTPDYCDKSDGTIQIHARAGVLPYSYDWSHGAVTAKVQELTFGNYSVTVTDSVACQTDTTIIIEKVEKPVIVSSSINNTTCALNNGSIAIEAIGETELTYFWEDQNTMTIPVRENLAPGTYRLVIRDEHACEIDSAFTVDKRPVSIVQSITTTPEYCNKQDGTVRIFMKGDAPYKVFYDSETSESLLLEGMKSKTYPIKIVDALNCEIDTFASIEHIDGPYINFTKVKDSDCTTANGSIDLEIAGGTPPYYYNWSDGTTEKNRYGLSADTYEFIGTDGNGCEVDSSFTILPIGADFPNIVSLTSLNENNQVFQPYVCPNTYNILRLQIFSRWGDLMYNYIPSSQTDGSSWDGIFRKLSLQPGVYIYTSEIQFSNGTVKQYAGDFTIVK